MDSLRHQRISELFAEAMHLDPQVRRAFLDSRCGDDPSLAAEVESLLAHHGRTSPPVATGVLNVGDLFDAVGSAGSQPGLGSALASTGRYTIQRVLGEGGMGTVYLAEQDRPRRTVALKVMRASVAGAGRMRKRFELEAEVLGRLEHPGIARIYDAGVASITTPDGTATVPYFAMEYVDGRPLIQFCDAERLGTRERMAVIADIAEAVAVAHRHGIVHRDLKPANILVTAQREAKVLDFGVARATDSDLDLTTMQTDVGQLIGTLGYMSPEQVVGDPTKVGVRSDVYALGAITYELLAGQPVVDARKHTVAQVARIIQDEEPRTLSSYSRVFRGDLETIVAKALEKDPTRRYADAHEFAADVRRYLRDEPIVARPATTLYQMSKFTRRNRALVGGIIATIVVLFLGLIGTTVGWMKANAATELAEASRKAAVDAQERADARFGQLRKLARSFMYDFHDMIVDLPGSMEARKKLVSTALEYLDGLAKEQSDDVELQNEVSEAYLRIGQVQGYGSKSNLGDRDGAMKSFEKALAIREAAAIKHPKHIGTLDGICIIRNHIANVKLAKGQTEEALADFKRVLDERKSIAELDPSSVKYRRAIGISHQWIGNTYRELSGKALGADGKIDPVKEREYLDLALENFRAQLAVSIALENEDENLVARDIPVALEKIGDVLRDLGENDAAIKEYNESLRRRELRYEKNKENSEARADLIASTGKIGAALLNLKRLDESLVYFKRSFELAQLTDREQVGDSQARLNYMIAYSRMAQIYSSLAQRAKERGEPIDVQRTFARDGLAAAVESHRLLVEIDAAGKLDPAKKPWIEIMAGLVQECQAVQDSIEAGATP